MLQTIFCFRKIYFCKNVLVVLKRIGLSIFNEFHIFLKCLSLISNIIHINR